MAHQYIPFRDHPLGGRNVRAWGGFIGCFQFQWMCQYSTRLSLMLANLQQTSALWLKAKTGLAASVFILLAVAFLAGLMLYIFLCVSAYEWLSGKFGPTFGGLSTAGLLLIIALICFVMAVLTRRRTQQHATLQRAGRTRASALL